MNPNDSEVERLIASFEEIVYQAIKAAIEQTRQEIDTATLAEAIASGDDKAIADALDIAAVNLQHKATDGLSEPFATFFDTVAIIAATVLGFTTYTPGRDAEVVRDNLRYRIAKSLWELHTEIATRISNIDIPAREIAARITQLVGLSAAQQKSLDTFVRILDRAATKGKARLSPAQLRRLNASQRSTLRKALASELSPEDTARLVEQQRGTMQKHRVRVIARATAHQAFNTAQQSTWEALNALGLIDGYRRFWIHAGDERVRTTHRAVPGLNSAGVGLQQPFLTPLGPCHMPPLEIGCRCRVELRRATE